MGAAAVEAIRSRGQPGQIMAAVALVRRVRSEGRAVTDADLDSLRNICRCGTYPRIRAAIIAAATDG